MKVYVVKYDNTQPYDPGEVRLLGVYTERWRADSRVAMAKIETHTVRHVDWDETRKCGRRPGGDWNYVYVPLEAPLYDDNDDNFEIIELELDDALSIQTSVMRPDGAAERAPIAGHPTL